MFNYIYEYYLAKKDTINAKKIGEQYLKTTLAYFNNFELLAKNLYGRKINQIYLVMAILLMQIILRL